MGKLSLSELLNTLDRVLLYEGRLLIMTTNYITHLDTVLIYTGCIDIKIELPYTDKDVIT